MVMSALTPPRARAPTQSVFYVVTEPWLLRLITSYQRGIPVLLYKLYVEHSPEPRRGRFTRKQLAELVGLVVEHGTPFHLSLLQSSHIYEDGKWYGPKLGRVPRWAVELRRADLLQWLISTRFQLGDPRLLWQAAVTNWESDADLALLDLLHSRSPLTTVKAQRILKKGLPDTPTVGLLQWLKNKCPDLALPRLFTRIAAEQGDISVLRFVAEHRSRTDCDMGAIREAYERGHFDVLEYLVAHFATYMRPDFAKALAVASEPSAQQIVDRHASVFVSAFRELVIDALRKGDYSKAQELLQALERRAKCTFHGSISIDDAATWKGLDGLKFLHERGLAVATTEAMDQAAEKQRWSVVKFLHMERTEGCTTRTMDAACKSGNLKCVRFFHKNRTEGCSTDAMDFAAEAGSMEILRYLHTHSSVGCTTDAMDMVASRGHLQVVQFLHENRSEGCTTEALDGAAIGGFLEITQYLCEHRSEGGTVEGVQDALENHHLEIVQVLYDRFPLLFGRELMFKLLLRGAFTIFMSLRDAFPDEANRVVNLVAFEAARQLEWRTIHFVVNDLRRTDLSEDAALGAERYPGPGNAQWSRAVRAAFGRPNPPVDAVHPFLLDSRTPTWAIRDLLHDLDDPSDAEPSWAVEAVQRRDVSLLEVLRDGPSHVADPRLGHLRARSLDSCGHLALRFAGARAAAIRFGNQPILEWLLTSVDVAVEPTLLGEAVYYHQYDIAEWLVATYPAACTELDWYKEGSEPNCGLQGDLLEWLERHDAVRKALPFQGIVDFAAQTNDVESLRRLCFWRPM